VPGRDHWVVRMNHRNRTGGFLLLLGVLALHLQAHEVRPSEASTWIALVMTFGVYPQLAWAWSRRSAAPVAAEVRNMTIDALLFGAWAAWLHFPDWITFALFISVTVNLTLFGGVRGLAQALAGFGTGAALVTLQTGVLAVTPTRPVVAATAAAALSLFLVVTALENHHRSMQLHHTRRRLRDNEQALQAELGENRGLHDELRRLARLDPLTGVQNRRALDEALAQAPRDPSCALRPLGLLMLDVDHFKRVNDERGHEAGDEVLRLIAALLRAGLRHDDLVYRYGGEEFVLLLPRHGRRGRLAPRQGASRACGGAPFRGR
jgi:GGDEF domain-containing protein